MANNRNIDIKVIKRLYANCGNKCTMPGCMVKLFPSEINLSEIAHIEGLNEGSARYNPNLSQNEVNAYDNLIVLCPTHHKEIDSEKNIQKYTVKYLKEIKKQQEEIINKRMDDKHHIFCDLNKKQRKIIKKKYKKLFGDERISKNDIRHSIENALNCDRTTREILYTILLYVDVNTTSVDINMKQVANELEDRYDMGIISKCLELLENNNYINEGYYIGEMESFIEDQNGEVHLVGEDYTFKLYNGTWNLDLRGKILISIHNKILKGSEEFYEFIMNRNYEILKSTIIEKISKKNDRND